MNLILFGFKSCGKTTLGKQIAQHLGRCFLDTDDLLERLYAERMGEKRTCREIFKEEGSEVFRALESDVVQQLKGVEKAIIATGGGLVLNPDHAASLAKLGQLVYLKLSRETLKQRVLERELPAYLDPSDPEESFARMYEQRKGSYEKILALPIDLETETQDQLVQEICALIQQGGTVHG